MKSPLSPDYQKILDSVGGSHAFAATVAAVGGGGGISIIIAADDCFFIKFTYLGLEECGSKFLDVLGEDVPGCGKARLTRSQIEIIGTALENRGGHAKFSPDDVLFWKNEIDVFISAYVNGSSFSEFATSKVKFQREEALYFAGELGRVSVKDFVCKIGDRILNSPNFGNIMLVYNRQQQVDLTRRIVLIDNGIDGEAEFSFKGIENPIVFIRNQVLGFLNSDPFGDKFKD